MKKDFFILFLFSCNKNNKTDKTESFSIQKEDSEENAEIDVDKATNDSLIDYTLKNISSNPIIKVDTIIENLDISYIIKDNEDVIVQPIIDGLGKKDTLYYADRSLYLTLKRENKTILLNRKFDKKDFSLIIPNDEQKDLQIMFFMINKLMPSKSVFSLRICVPDSDDCYFIKMIILDSGKIIVEEELEEEETDNV